MSRQPARIASRSPTGISTGMTPNAPALFDRALLLARQRRALELGPATFLLDRVKEDMEERLRAVLRQFADVADVWTPGAALPSGMFKAVTHLNPEDSGSETLPLRPESLDLAVSALAFQFVNDLPGVFAQIRRALKPDGLLLAAMIGGDTLTELRQCFTAAEAEREGGVSPRGRAVCRSARRRRAIAARGLCVAGHRRRPRGGALRRCFRADGATCGGWVRPTSSSSGGECRPAAARCCGWRRFTPSALPIPMAASAPPLTSSGSRAGRRTKASNSRSSRDRRKRAWRRH